MNAISRKTGKYSLHIFTGYPSVNSLFRYCKIKLDYSTHLIPSQAWDSNLPKLNQAPSLGTKLEHFLC